MKYKIIINVIIGMLFINTSFAFAFDLNNINKKNITDKIITSLEKEPEKWVLRNNDICYFDDDELRKIVKNHIYLEMSEGCLINISYNIFYKEPYIIIDKPFKLHPSDYDEMRLLDEIEQYMFNHLWNKGYRIPNTSIKETKIIKEKPKKENLINDIYSIEDKY